ncbi:unnamed protein product, partial [Nesidiocoris tenuis]
VNVIVPGTECDNAPTTTRQHDKSPDDSVHPPARKRKSTKRSREWSRNQEKMKRLRGEPYVGFRRAEKGSTKRIIHDVPRDGRTMGPTCDSLHCRKVKTRACNSITEEERQKIFDDFWKVMTWDFKRMFVCSTVSAESKKQQTRTQGPVSRRQASLFYHLEIQGRRVPVCREMYLRTLGIRRSELHYWVRNYVSSNVPQNKSQETQSPPDSCSESSDETSSSHLVQVCHA